MKHPKVDYHSYLDLDKLLSAQNRQSVKLNKPAHDELLFITVHQTYELWFKQIIFEVEAVIDVFKEDKVQESKMGVALARLERVAAIQKFILGQVDILETMTPPDFLDFRDMLYPASGFQSVQFRVFENKLGLLSKERVTYNNANYAAHFPKDQKSQVQSSEKEPSLFDCIEKWLARTPFVTNEEFDFWALYKEAVTKMFEQERVMINNSPTLDEASRKDSLHRVETAENTFTALFSEKQYKELTEKGVWRLSYKAIKAALLIQMYRYEPALQLPFRLINTIMDIDESLSQWRYRHMLMVKRMLGSKVGTGGSSGSDYLRMTADKHKVFSDFSQLITFLVPSSACPPLPPSLKKSLDFNFYA